MNLQKKLFTGLIVAACALVGVAAAQTIAAPASSSDSGARATVGIAPVDLSGIQNQINTVANTANSAYYYGTTAYTTANTAYSTATSAANTANTAANTANSAYYYGYNAFTNQNGTFGQPWSKYFTGQIKSGNSALGNMYIYIDGNGYLYYGLNSYNWVAVGYTSGPGCVSRSGTSGSSWYWAFNVCPTTFDFYGRPTNWGVAFASGMTQVSAGSPY